MRRIAMLGLMAACGSGSSSPPPAHPAAVAPAGASDAELQAQHDREARAKHDEIVAAHRKIEEQQQDALAASCDDAQHHEAHARCQPSCYVPAAPDPRAGKKLRGAVEIQHEVCQLAADAPYVILDDIDPKLVVRPLRGRRPRAHRKGTWQADVEKAVPVVVTGTWRELTDPVTKERVRCVTAARVTSLARPLDACGGTGEIACEAAGNAAAHGLDVIHYRLVEARRLQAAGKAQQCQQAALEAIAVSRGMPRWHQYAKLNVEHWGKQTGFRTRFDGVLDEDTLFETATRLGGEADGVYAACGGAGSAVTTAEQEQSFHTCW
ncbi:MAG: hypothetical protein ACM31C_28990 [Acidobacteriota bacterium]